MSTIDPEKMDSNEEVQFYEWLLEAEKAGLVSEIQYQPRPFILSERITVPVEKKLKTKTKIVQKFLLHPHQYTADFVFVWDDFLSPFFGMYGVIWVDVKGTGSRFHDDKQFSINQKWVWSSYEVYINKVVPDVFFQKTWCPEACRKTPKTRKLIKKYVEIGNIDGFIAKQIAAGDKYIQRLKKNS